MGRKGEGFKLGGEAQIMEIGFSIFSVRPAQLSSEEIGLPLVSTES